MLTMILKISFGGRIGWPEVHISRVFEIYSSFSCLQ